MSEQSGDQRSESRLGVLTALQLGWLVTETYGRLRAAPKPKKTKGRQTARFAYSDNTRTASDELVWNVSQLHHRVAKLGADIDPPPLPLGEKLEQKLGAELNLDKLQGELDEWSKQVWSLLNLEDGTMGRAFRYGGSLADTYWHTVKLEPDDEKGVARLLSEHRLRRIATQFGGIAERLPPYVAHAIQRSLDRWSRVNVALIERKRLEQRLNAQRAVWSDLLFGRQSAESYLTVADRRSMNLRSTAAQVGLTLVIVSLVAVAGWGIGSIFPSDTDDLSGFFAAVSSLIALMVGLARSFSSWVRQFGDLVKERQKLKLIARRTFRSWRFRQQPARRAPSWRDIGGIVVDRLRTRSARLISGWQRRPRPLVVRAWAWLCAHSRDPDEKLRCLTAILELDPELEWAQLALQQVRQQQEQVDERGTD